MNTGQISKHRLERPRVELVLLSDWGVGEREDYWTVELAELLWSDDQCNFTSSRTDKSVSIEEFVFERKLNCSRLIFGTDMVDFRVWFREGVYCFSSFHFCVALPTLFFFEKLLFAIPSVLHFFPSQTRHFNGLA